MKRTLVFLLLSCLFLHSPLLQSEDQKTIGMMLYKVQGSDPWDPESIKKGITGSEEAVIYISRELAKLGYQVVVYGDPPKGSRHSMLGANPRYVHFTAPDEKKLDIAVLWRMPDKAEAYAKRASKVYLWPHDTYYWKLTEAQIDAFEGVLWLSQWQRMQWISINPSFTKYKKIFGNGIVPSQFKKIKERENPYSCIYGSNYSRGLEVLLNAWPNVKKQFPRATLDVYYGWQHWGTLTPQQEAKLRAQMAALKSFDVNEHGLVSHDELNRAFEKTSFWTYPCTAPEVFCITALRAQFAGALPVIIQGSGLNETVPHGFSCTTAAEYEATLINAMQKAETITVEDRIAMEDFIKKRYTWAKIARKWQELFDK